MHRASPTTNLPGADHCLLRIVATLDDQIRTQRNDRFERCVFVEYHHGIDHRERREQVSALPLAADGTFRALQPADRCIAVDADHERIPGAAGREEQVDMTGMKEIEHAVGEYDVAANLSP